MATDATIRVAVLDAGPLFSALVSHFNLLQMERNRQRRFSNVLSPNLRSEAAQHDLLNWISSIRDKLTSSHVIGELQGLQTSRLRLTGPDLYNFWQASIDLLTQWNLDERLIRVLELASQVAVAKSLFRIGVPDGGLLQLARQHGCPVFTDDTSTLAPEAWKTGVECILVQQVIPLRPSQND